MTASGRRQARAWVLNLDAEYELAFGEGYTRGEATARQLDQAAARLGDLVAPDDHVVPLDGPVEDASGRSGVAWCPTTSALALLAQAGAIVPDAPEMSTLRRVNDRAFAIELGLGSLESHYVTDLADLVARVAEIAGTWVLKRGLSFAGRGHRRGAGQLGPEDLSWCRSALAGGTGLVVEPWVDRLGDYAVHGIVGRDRGVVLAPPTSQACDRQGIWRETVELPNTGPHRLEPAESISLGTAGLEVGRALAAAGYFGPFGVDAFRYRTGGEVRFNPVCEVNARYCMGFALSHLALAGKAASDRR